MDDNFFLLLLFSIVIINKDAIFRDCMTRALICKRLRNPGIDSCAGILEQSKWARNRVGIGCRTGPQGYIGYGRIDSLVSIPELLKCLKIPALGSLNVYKFGLKILPYILEITNIYSDFHRILIIKH